MKPQKWRKLAFLERNFSVGYQPVTDAMLRCALNDLRNRCVRFLIFVKTFLCIFNR